jgi:2-polyprenyl-3-methyl-5-hydroxy-6-metoxy-1,4-benzoquinol methylase
MSGTQLAQDARRVVIARATWGGSQNFLGAHWVEQAIGRCPARIRKHIALRFLALSPHYFYARDIRAEDARNRASRQRLAETLVPPRLSAGARVLDYGCGPGYLAYAVAAQAGHVDAVDISRGVLASARVLTARRG